MNEILCIFDSYKTVYMFLIEIVKQINSIGLEIERVDRKKFCIKCGGWEIICTSVNGSNPGVSRDRVKYFYKELWLGDSNRAFDEGIKYTLPPWAEEIKDRHTLVKILAGELR